MFAELYHLGLGKRANDSTLALDRDVSTTGTSSGSDHLARVLGQDVTLAMFGIVDGNDLSDVDVTGGTKVTKVLDRSHNTVLQKREKEKRGVATCYHPMITHNKQKSRTIPENQRILATHPHVLER